MTVESLIDRAAQYASWLYNGREWARWELLTAALTALVLVLLLMIRQRRKAKTRIVRPMQTPEHSPTIGINLDTGRVAHHGLEDFKGNRLASVSNSDGKQKRWKEATRKWTNFQKLIEQLQHEITKYRQAEECLEQQFAKLKAANERLLQEVTASERVTQNSDLVSSRTSGSFGIQQDRMLDAREVITENS